MGAGVDPLRSCEYRAASGLGIRSSPVHRCRIRLLLHLQLQVFSQSQSQAALLQPSSWAPFTVFILPNASNPDPTADPRFVFTRMNSILSGSISSLCAVNSQWTERQPIIKLNISPWNQVAKIIRNVTMFRITSSNGPTQVPSLSAFSAALPSVIAIYYARSPTCEVPPTSAPPNKTVLVLIYN